MKPQTLQRQPGGEFAGAWAALAAASPRRRRDPSRNAFPLYSTTELVDTLSSDALDAETRSKIEAEIARRRA